ncbi:MAG: hypothetical protein IKC28_09330 [Clostridia bacterium]|nr:hypothetical protein [Clostridia bacterium]
MKHGIIPKQPGRRTPALLGAALCLLLFLTGCSAASGEKQIFPICMSMDRLSDGRLQLAVQVSQMGSDKSDEYAVFTAAGDTFGQTLEILGASMPYPLHFGQLRLCMVGYSLAVEEELHALLMPLDELYTINPRTAVVVCMGNAAQTMAAQKPDLGVRLSTYLDQLLARLRQEKLTPPETLRDVVRMLKAGRRDPLLGLCSLNDAAGPDDAAKGSSGSGSTPGESSTQAVFGPSGRIAIGEPSPGDDLPPDMTAGSLPRKGGNPVEYIGCAVVGQGRVTGTLTALETRLALTLRQEGRVSHVTKEEAWVILPPEKNLELNQAAQLVTKCQQLGCDLLDVTSAYAKENPTISEDFLFLKPDAMRLTITYKGSTISE